MCQIFVGKNLRGKSFKGQDLTGADFSGKDIRGTDFSNATLKGANFSGVKAGLTYFAQSIWIIVSLLLSLVLGIFSATIVLWFLVMVNELPELVDKDVSNWIISTITILILSIVFSATGIALQRKQGAKIFILTIISMVIVMGVVTILVGVMTEYAVHTTEYRIALNKLPSLLAGMTVLIALAGAIVVPGTLAFTWIKVGILTLIFTKTRLIIGIMTSCMAIIGVGIVVGSTTEIIPGTEILASELTEALTAAEGGMEDDYSFKFWVRVVTIVGSTIILFFVSYLTWRTLYKEDLQLARIRNFALCFRAFGATNFNGANLTDANFRGAMLKNVHFAQATVARTCWSNTQKLKFACISGTILENRAVRELLVTRKAKGQSFLGCNLQGAYLVNADLSEINFSKSDLSGANLRNADLQNANLTEAILIGATLEGADLTGACLQAWNIDSTTQLEGTKANYVYLEANQQERCPSNPDKPFAEDDFSKLFQEVLNTVALIFRDGIDWQAFIVSFDELREKIRIESEEAEIFVQSIENKGDGVFVVKVNVPPEVDKGKVEREFELKYENQLKLTEEKYQALLEEAKEEKYQAVLEAKNESIEILKNSTVLERILEILAKNQGQMEVEYNQFHPTMGNNKSRYTQFSDDKTLAEKSSQSLSTVNNPNKKDDKMENQQSADVVIITALEKERDAVLRYLDSPKKVQTKNRIVYKSNLHHENSDSFYQIILLCLEAMGNVHAAIATTQAIDIWNPDIIILTGIMGGIEKEKERYLGDLIAAEQIVGYEMGKLTDAGTERRYDVLRPAHAFITAARSFPPEKWALASTIPRPDDPDRRTIPKIHWGAVASGEKVIADTKTSAELQNHWLKLTGVEMEGYGTALAVYTAESRPGFFMVKGICDWANPDKNDKWQAYAADVAAVYVVNLLKAKPFSSHFEKHQAQIKVPLHYLGKIKIQLCQRLGTNWQDLADYFDIPAHRSAQFRQGRECQAIWEWLEERDRLYSLKEALDFLERPDLVELLNC